MLKILCCNHAKKTFPQTPRGKQTYVACLQCGKEFLYSWTEMRIGAELPPKVQPVKEARA